jgi:hypothetical protein
MAMATLSMIPALNLDLNGLQNFYLKLEQILTNASRATPIKIWVVLNSNYIEI